MKYLAVPLAKAGIHTAECLPKFDVAAIQKEFTKKNAPVAPDAGVVEKLQDMKISDKELEIVFFGTGCSAASKHRNGILQTALTRTILTCFQRREFSLIFSRRAD